MKRIIALLLSVLMLLSCAACGNKNKEEETQPAETQPQGDESNPLEAIPDVDMDREVVILSGGSCGDWLTGDTGEPISDAKYKRTLALEEKFNVYVKLAGKSDSDLKFHFHTF